MQEMQSQINICHTVLNLLYEIRLKKTVSDKNVHLTILHLTVTTESGKHTACKTETRNNAICKRFAGKNNYLEKLVCHFFHLITPYV